MIKSWCVKIGAPIGLFKYPADIRRINYTTNSIEAVHRQFRKLSKTKSGFPMYMGIHNASKKRIMPKHWNLTLSQMSIFFEGRLDEVLDL